MATNSQLTAFTLDDFDARSGSAASIIRTIAGLYLRHEVSPVARGKVIDLACAAGISVSTAQTAVSRLIDRGIFDVAPGSQLRVPAPAQEMFARGNRRIFVPRQMDEDEQWCLVAYSLPESLRPLRHQLRKHFLHLGGGLVSAGLWIFPAHLHDEVLQILEVLGARQHATVFLASCPDYPGGPQQAAQRWWDLEKLSAMHQTFLSGTDHLSLSAQDPEVSYLSYVVLIDAWRALPYLDPGLPSSMLPADWPGIPSRERFLSASAIFSGPAAQFVQDLLAA